MDTSCLLLTIRSQTRNHGSVIAGPSKTLELVRTARARWIKSKPCASRGVLSFANDLPGVFDARGIYESWISRCVDGAWSRRRVRLESRFGPDPVTRSESGEVATAKNAVGRSGHARNLEQRDRDATRASEGTRREGAAHRHGGAGVRTADRGSTCEG